MVPVNHIPSPFGRIHMPAGLPDDVYASWMAALLEFRDSPTFSAGERHYQFCIGYTQALRDAKIIDECLCRFLMHQVEHIWINMKAPFSDTEH